MPRKSKGKSPAEYVEGIQGGNPTAAREEIITTKPGLVLINYDLGTGWDSGSRFSSWIRGQYHGIVVGRAFHGLGRDSAKTS